MGKTYKVTGHKVRKMEAIFEDDGKLDLKDQAIAALKEGYKMEYFSPDDELIVIDSLDEGRKSEFPKYVQHPGGTALRLVQTKGGNAIYERPIDTGAWELEATFIDGKIISKKVKYPESISEVLLTEITKEQFMEDNGYK